MPGSSFYRAGSPEGRRQVRFTFCKTEETLVEAGRRLAHVRDRLKASAGLSITRDV